MKCKIFCYPDTNVLEGKINDFLQDKQIKIIEQTFTTTKYYKRELINRCPFCAITTYGKTCPKCKTEYLEPIEKTKPNGIFYIKEIIYEEIE